MRSYLFIFLLLGALIAGQHGVSGKQTHRTEKQIFGQFMKYVTKKQTATDVTEFRKIIEILSFPRYIYRAPLSTYSEKQLGLSCVACRSAVKTILAMHNQGSTEEQLTDIVTDMCTLLEIQPEHVCRGLVELNLPIIIYIVDNEPAFSPETFCGVLLQSNDKSSCPYDDTRFEWSLELPSKDTTTEPPAQGDSSLKIVQLSDLHYDPIYEPSGLAECNEPTCCRKGQTERASPRWRSLYDDESLEKRISQDEKGSYILDLDYAVDVQERKAKAMKDHTVGREIPESKQAGFWGDYRDCDTPWWALEDTLNRVAENHNDIDYVYYTGDMIDHGVWETTQEQNTKSIQQTFNLLKDTFGSIPLFPVIGNHESQPLNQYAPKYITDPKFSTAWLYKLLAEQWSVWLPADTVETIMMGGYYTTLARPGLRIVVLNSNLCYRYNWWVQMDPKDPSGQLTWLIEVLTQAESNNEIVHILSHIPPGITDCYATYTREYKRIIERFSDTIAAEFNGHTHNDEFKIFYSSADIDRPVAVAWNGGSVTAYSDVNPNYRTYEVDSNNYDVLDMETWVYNLTEANLTPDVRPRWYKEYSFKEHFGLSSLSLDQLDSLVQRMVSTEQRLLVDDYHIFRGKNSDPYINKHCDDKCVMENLRYLSITELYDDRKYNALWKTFQENNKTMH